MIDAVALTEVLRLPALAHARVVGGRGGLQRVVRAVNVMEVPDILDWVKADELLLTTAYPLRDDRVALDALVPRLAGRGLAGIAVKPARYIEEIPASMIEAADRHDFPLIELPPEASFNEIIQSVLTVILNSQAERLQRTAAIHDRFTAIVLSGGGLRQIAEALAELIDRPIAILDGQGVAQWRTSDGAPAADTAGSAIVQAIQVGSDRYGSILVGPEGDPLGADQLEAIEYAATVAALRQVQTRVMAEADRRFQAVCLEELITGHVSDRSVLMERAAAFAWDLATPRAVLLADIESIAGTPFADLVGTAEEGALRHRLAEAARTSLGPGAIVWERSREIGALVSTGPGAGSGGHAAHATASLLPPSGGATPRTRSPAPARPTTGASSATVSELRELGDALQAEAARRLPGAIVSVAIGGGAPDPLDLHRSFGEARRALEVGRWGQGPGGVTVFEGLGLDRILARLPESEVAAFCVSMLGRLEAYDASHGTSLVETLDTFLATRNAALAARELFLHYNTLKNRLVRIEEILGPYLDDPGRCLSLSLALRLRRLPRA
ncbi:MAG: PucR family transcriptional regulator ligand-binding domain-containing protein [Chloroflexota bacterium]